MGLFHAILWLGLPFAVLVVIGLVSPRRKYRKVEIWADDRAVWKRINDSILDQVLWKDVVSVSVGPRENAFGRSESAYILTTEDGVQHEYLCSTVGDDFLGYVSELPGFELDHLERAVSEQNRHTVICWKS